MFSKISADVLVIEVIKILIWGLSAIIFSISGKSDKLSPTLAACSQINLPEGLLICLVTQRSQKRFGFSFPLKTEIN